MAMPSSITDSHPHGDASAMRFSPPGHGLLTDLNRRGLLPSGPGMSGDAHRRHHLLLEVARVAAVVEGADRRRVVDRSAGRVAEVVTDEAGGCIAHAEPECRVQLRVPRVLAQ